MLGVDLDGSQGSVVLRACLDGYITVDVVPPSSPVGT
jgi:hypothetical protein